MTKKLHFYAVLAIVVVLACSWALMLLIRAFEQPGELLAYVASADRRIYVLDLENGATIAVSDPLDGLGRPTSLEIDPSSSTLYIGSERGFGQKDYYPLVAVDVSDGFEIVGQYTLDPTRNAIDESVLNSDVYAVYRVVASKSANRLFLGYAAPGRGLATEFDVVTGAIVRDVDVPITPNSLFSPDGSLLAEVWPSGRRSVDGGTVEWPGGVVIKVIATGATVSQIELADNRGLQPPWDTPTSPFVYLSRPEGILRAYDRESGRIVSSADLMELSGMSPAGAEPKLFENSIRAALPMIMSAPGGNSRGFVVVVDYMMGEIVHTIEVGAQPTNVVLDPARRLD